VKSVFADTSYWVALTDREDSLYQTAGERSDLVGSCLIVTSDAVLIEYLATFAGRGEYWRKQAVEYVDKMLKNPQVQIVPDTHQPFTTAFDLYRQRPDKEYSLVDCDSMNIMRSRSITEVLTEDHHFKQEGFVPLLAEEQNPEKQNPPPPP